MNSINNNNFSELMYYSINKKSLVARFSCNGKKYVIKQSLGDKQYSDMLYNELSVYYILKDTGIIPKIVTYDFGVQNCYIIYEYIEGEMLRHKHFKSLKEKIEYFLKIVDCMKIVHDNGIIHLDLKPTNIIIRNDGKVQLIDFGISAMNGCSKFSDFASKNYCSIEQMTKQELTTQSDIYSLGVIFYEMLTSNLPFTGDIDNLRIKKSEMDFVKTNNKSFDYIFNKLLNNNLKKRYRDLNTLKQDLIKLKNDLEG